MPENRKDPFPHPSTYKVTESRSEGWGPIQIRRTSHGLKERNSWLMAFRTCFLGHSPISPKADLFVLMLWCNKRNTAIAQPGHWNPASLTRWLSYTVVCTFATYPLACPMSFGSCTAGDDQLSLSKPLGENYSKPYSAKH